MHRRILRKYVPAEAMAMKKLTATLLAPVLALLLGSPALADDVAPATGRVDVNTASKEQLRATLGVDEDEADKIIEGRPYTRKDDLKTRQVLTASEYEKLQRLIESVC
jgi:DNA uptake protein ComE-like DNA-binding protein